MVVEVVEMELAGAAGAPGVEASWGTTGTTLVTIAVAAGGVVVMTAVHAVQVDVKVCVLMKVVVIVVPLVT